MDALMEDHYNKNLLECSKWETAHLVMERFLQLGLKSGTLESGTQFIQQYITVGQRNYFTKIFRTLPL